MKKTLIVLGLITLSPILAVAILLSGAVMAAVWLILLALEWPFKVLSGIVFSILGGGR